MEEKKIICPYCFAEFNHDEVLFRSETFFFEEDIEDKDDILDIADQTERANALEEYNKKMRFKVGVSSKYDRYWSRFNGTTEKTRRKSGARNAAQNIDNYQKPIINPKDSSVVRFNNQNKTGVEFDRDGFLSSIDDVYGRHSNSRVCPECHNPLPQNYGKYPVKFISIIGITNAGKTVYLSSLLDNVLDYMDKIGITPYQSDSVDFFIELNKIKKGTVLPQGTSTQQMCQPLCFNLQYFDSRTHKDTKTTFVIYDIAGENCTSSEAVVNFGDFIRHSDGIIILEDPNQFKGIYDDEKQTMVDSVLGTINDLFIGKKYCDIPTAVCISKSDILMSDNMFSQILEAKLREPVRSAEDINGFNAKDYNDISKLLDSFYFDHDKPTRTALKNSFNNYNYFAVSALNCKLEPSNEIDGNGKSLYVPAERPHPMRIEEPLYWMFTQFGFIDSDIEITNHAIVGDLEKLNAALDQLQDEKSKVGGIGLFKKRRINDLDKQISEIEATIKEKINTVNHKPY